MNENVVPDSVEGNLNEVVDMYDQLPDFVIGSLNVIQGCYKLNK